MCLAGNMYTFGTRWMSSVELQDWLQQQIRVNRAVGAVLKWPGSDAFGHDAVAMHGSPWVVAFRQCKPWQMDGIVRTLISSAIAQIL